MTNQIKVKATQAERLIYTGILFLIAVSFFIPWVGDTFFEYHDDLFAYMATNSFQYANVVDVHRINESQAGVIIIVIFSLILLTIIGACIPMAKTMLRISALLVGVCACLITLCTFLIASASHHINFFEEVGIFDGFYLTLLCGIALVALSLWKLFGDQGRKSSVQ